MTVEIVRSKVKIGVDETIAQNDILRWNIG